MSRFKIVDAYEACEESKFDNFKDNMRSTVNVATAYDKVETSFEWLDLMEDSIHYIDNILRNPNRFIINEDEIVKIELARRITVESIKHLSRNTNFIQEINEFDEIRPSKILNINKEESFITYENRLIYTLISRMRDFIEIKKKDVLTPYLKDSKKVEFNAKSSIGAEKINMNMIITSKIDTSKDDGDQGGASVEERIAKLESDINMLAGTDVYRDLAKKRAALILPPVKKTNVILKNVNFQYAMKLWDYLHSNLDPTAKRKKGNKNYEDGGLLKEHINETFLLNYLAISTLNEEEVTSNKEEIVEELTNNLIERIVELNVDLPEEKLKDLIGTKIRIARNKKIASLSEIQNTISNQIKLYIAKIESFEIERDLI